MAVSRANSRELPSGAVIITEDQALAYQWKIVSGWEKISEVWSLRFSCGILGGISAATGIFVNAHYRRKLRLGEYGKFSTYLPIVIIPAMFSMLTHRFFVQRQIMLGQIGQSTCPVCVQVRAGAIQTGLGVVYPTLLAPFAAFMFATRHFTYRLPSITEEPKAVLQLYRHMTKPALPTLGSLALFHMITAMFLTYREMEEYFMMHQKLKRLEQDSLDFQ